MIFDTHQVREVAALIAERDRLRAELADRDAEAQDLRAEVERMWPKQITTAEELESLPLGTWLVSSDGSAVNVTTIPLGFPEDLRGYRSVGAITLTTRSAEATLDNQGPLTVVWQP